MPLIIGDTHFESTDDATLSRAAEAVQRLRQLPIVHETKLNPTDALTLLQRETCFIEAGSMVKNIATVDLMQCMLVVCKGTNDKGEAVYLSAHTDVTHNYGWSTRLSTMGKHIDVFIVGGEAGTDDSIKTLHNLLKYLIDFSTRFDVTIVFQGQRILADFRQTRLEFPEQCKQYVLKKATIAYREMFQKELSPDFDASNFGIDPQVYLSSIPHFEELLSRLGNQVKANRGNVMALMQLGREAMTFRPHFQDASGFNLIDFSGVLFTAGQSDPEQKSLFKQGCSRLAPTEIEFEEKLRKLFSPLGYDSVRQLLLMNGNKRITMYTQFCVNVENWAVSPVSERFRQIPFVFQRSGMIMDLLGEELKYWECFANGAYQKPTLSPAFLEMCDKVAVHFKDPQENIPQQKLLAIMQLFKLASSSSIKQRNFCDFMFYYVAHRDEFQRQEKVVKAPQQPPAKASQAVKPGFFNAPPKKAEAKKAEAKKSSELKGGLFETTPKKK